MDVDFLVDTNLSSNTFHAFQNGAKSTLDVRLVSLVFVRDSGGLAPLELIFNPTYKPTPKSAPEIRAHITANLYLFDQKSLDDIRTIISKKI